MMDDIPVVDHKIKLSKRRWDLGVVRYMTGDTYDILIDAGYTAEELGGSRPNRTTYHSEMFKKGFDKQKNVMQPRKKAREDKLKAEGKGRERQRKPKGNPNRGHKI